MPRLNSVPQKPFLVLYWLAFACLSVYAAQSPGYGPRWAPLPPFPWVGLVFTWGLLAFGVILLHLIFRSPKPLYRKMLVALGVYGALSVGAVLTFVTDMPGLYYIPGDFAMVTFVGLVMMAVARLATHTAKRLRHAP